MFGVFGVCFGVCFVFSSGICFFTFVCRYLHTYEFFSFSEFTYLRFEFLSLVDKNPYLRPYLRHRYLLSTYDFYFSLSNK